MSVKLSKSILLIGESGVGKTHYGAQLLRRLMVSDGKLRMVGAATNLEPFEAALESLNEGRAASHTPTDVYLESLWPVGDDAGLSLEMIWPDYGGEQIRTMISTKRVATAWQSRIEESSAWMLLIRPSQLKASDDLLSKPSADAMSQETSAGDKSHVNQTSDQARLIELLQMLLFLRSANLERPLELPRLTLLLTCWDELNAQGTPEEVLSKYLPMLHSFVKSNWENAICLGLSALGRPLASKVSDVEYAAKGPEQFGFVICEDGTSTPDLTMPIYATLGDMD
jgi:hypothetical protein